MEKYKITIDGAGNPTIEAFGFTGCGCTEATGPVERAFGGEVHREAKPEMQEITPDTETQEGITI